MKYFLYRHIRLDKNVPFYIGVGTKPKKIYNFEIEYRRAFKTKERNFLWKRVFNISPVLVDILYESNDRNEILQKEKEFIRLYKRICDGGTLVNLTIGGERISDSCRESNRIRGLKTFGEIHPSSVLTEKEVLKIIELFNSGVRPIKIYRIFNGVSRHTIYSILKGKIWKHLSHLISKQAMINLHDGNFHHLCKKVIDINTNEIYHSVAYLSKKINKPETTVRNWVTGKCRKVTQYKFLNN